MISFLGRTPDIQIQGIFADRFPVIVFQRNLVIMITDDLSQGIIYWQILHLHGHWGKMICFQNSFPCICRLRFFPTQITDRRLGIWNTGKDLCLFVFCNDARQISLCYVDQICFHRVFRLHSWDQTDRRPGDPKHNAAKDQKSDP